MNRKLKALRVLNSLTQENMAKELGMTTSNYNLKENGKLNFTLEEAKKMSDIFGTSIEEIFFKEE